MLWYLAFENPAVIYLITQAAQAHVSRKQKNKLFIFHTCVVWVKTRDLSVELILYTVECMRE